MKDYTLTVQAAFEALMLALELESHQLTQECRDLEGLDNCDIKLGISKANKIKLTRFMESAHYDVNKAMINHIESI